MQACVKPLVAKIAQLTLIILNQFEIFYRHELNYQQTIKFDTNSIIIELKLINLFWHIIMQHDTK